MEVKYEYMEVKYEYKESPLKEAIFQATGGSNCIIEVDGDNHIIFYIGNERATFDKNDLRQLFEVLNKFYNQL